MTSMARFLLRFDDITPRMNWSVWDRVENILETAGVSPLLAVVPANADPELDFGPAKERFWQQVRQWQRRGWSIGLHGFEHRYVTRAAGILGRNRYSEFAGLPEAEQRSKLSAALDIFRREHVAADAFVAPAHSFDQTTVRLLDELGVDCISDGYALYPFVCERGLLWVPQQLGKFRPMPVGIWTICLHINDWTRKELAQFERNITAHKGQIDSFGRVRRQYAWRRQRLADRVFGSSFRLLRAVRG